MKQGTNYKYKFSIVTAVYNVENYLEEAIESIINQDIGFLDSVEIILADDGSTDGSGKICDAYRDRYPNNIKVIHKRNGGASSARNAGIQLAEGRYVNFMDSDDMLSPNTLSAVYNYFSKVDQEIDLISIPIFFFEGKNIPHRLNYKYASGLNQIIDLEKQYSFVQMSAASSFFIRDILTPNFFDNSLRYAEDAKAIMGMFLKNHHYGIVPEGRYLYRFRSTMNSTLNGSKLHREWYLDCLKDYILWSAEAAMEKFDCVPKFVQYSLMYDLQGRFRMEEIPEGVLTDGEKDEFEKFLKKILSFIDDQIILEQRNLSREQKDYIIGIKESSGDAVYEYSDEDAWLRYKDTATYPLSSYMLKIENFDIEKRKIRIRGSVKLNCKFPYPSEIYVRLVSGDKVSKVPCSFERNPGRVFRSMGKTLAQFTDFQAVVPRKMLTGSTRLDFCMTCDSHTVRFRNLSTEDNFPLPAGKKQIYLESKRMILKCEGQKLILEPISLKRYLSIKYHRQKKNFRSEK